MHIEGLQEQLTELSTSSSSQTRKLSEAIDRLKKDRRRLDELVTFKEGQVERLECEINQWREAVEAERGRWRKEADKW